MNSQIYGQKEPPKIDFNNIDKAGIPIGLYIPKNDRIVNVKW